MKMLIYDIVKTGLILGSINGLRYFLIAGIAFLIFYIFFPNQFFKAKIQANIAPNAAFFREIKYSLLSGFITAFIIALILKSDLKNSSLIYDQINEYPIYWIFVSYFLAILFHDTWFYWTHRLMHHPKLYKYVHKVHHQSTDPSPFAAFSFHPLEALVEAGAYIIFSFLFPVHLMALIGGQLLQMLLNVIAQLS